MITAVQIRAARAMLRIAQEELAWRSGVSIMTIRQLETSEGERLVAKETVAAIVKLLQVACVDFIHKGVSLNSAA